MARVKAVLGLEMPYSQIGGNAYWDGGTRAQEWQGAAGRTTTFAWDKRLSERNRRVWLNVEYPEKPGGKPLRKGSQEEQAVLDLLRLYADQWYPLSTQDSLLAALSDLPHGSQQEFYKSEQDSGRGHALSALRLAHEIETLDRNWQ